MKRYKYVFYRYYRRSVHEYYSFEDTLQSFISDFNLGKAYGIDIYD